MRPAIIAAVLVLAGCAPTVWEKPGADDAMFRSEARACRSGAPSLLAAEACMRARGWSKSARPGNPASTVAGFVGTPDPVPAPVNFLNPPADTSSMRAPAAPEPMPRIAVPVYTPRPAPVLHCIGQVPIPNLAVGPTCP
jgi:hypothetical protein